MPKKLKTIDEVCRQPPGYFRKFMYPMTRYLRRVHEEDQQRNRIAEMQKGK